MNLVGTDALSKNALLLLYDFWFGMSSPPELEPEHIEDLLHGAHLLLEYASCFPTRRILREQVAEDRAALPKYLIGDVASGLEVHLDHDTFLAQRLGLYSHAIVIVIPARTTHAAQARIVRR